MSSKYDAAAAADDDDDVIFGGQKEMKSAVANPVQHEDGYFSNLPDLLEGFPEIDEPVILGIDEAGRGPVLGPMVYACAWCAKSDQKALKKLGYDDSKALKEGERDRFFDGIKARSLMSKEDIERARAATEDDAQADDDDDTVKEPPAKKTKKTAKTKKASSSSSTSSSEPQIAIGWRVHVSSPEELSNKMLRRQKYDLNSISHDAAIWMIDYVRSRGVHVAEVYVDTVGDAGRYEKKLQARFPGIRVRVEAKADALYPIVSAASICAKVSRDVILKQWQFREPSLAESSSKTVRQLGSGYPGDAKTKEWLVANSDSFFGSSSLVRFSWKTVDKLSSDLGHEQICWDEEDCNEDNDFNHARHTPFPWHNHGRPDGLWQRRFAFFTANSMDSVEDF